MPGSNPVASTPGASHSKSFRSRLGFGGSSGAPSTKPSFFSLKPGRKSFGGPSDSRGHDRPVLAIDPEKGHGKSPHENGVVLNDDTERNQLPQKPESFIKDLPFRLSKNIISHSLPASPTRSLHTPHSDNANSDIQPSPPKSAGAHVDPDGSGLSKHLPDLSTDLSLLMNEQPPESVSQSDQESKNSQSEINGLPAALSRRKGRDTRVASRTVQGFLASMTLARPSISPLGGPEQSESAVSGLTSSAVENASTSFDLSTAKFSLDLIRKSLGDEWARSLDVEDSSIRDVETDARRARVSPLIESGGGPVTSTPFRPARASPARAQDTEAEVSFNLDALDPDLVALLRPSTYDQGLSHSNRVTTPSPSEPFAPPLDPLNPDTTVKAPAGRPASLSTSPSRTHEQMDEVTQTPIRKYATLSASISSVKPLRLARSNTTQDFTPHAFNPSSVDNRLDTQQVQARARADGQLSPPITSSSDMGTPSDTSKQPSPLSAAPLTLDDLGRGTSSAPSSATSASTTNLNNVTMRRKNRTGGYLQEPPSRAGSALMSSTDSRPAHRYSIQDRDRELRQASASPSPTSPRPYPYASGSLGRERDRTRAPLDSLFRGRFSPERTSGRPNSSSSGGKSHMPHIGSGLHHAFPRAREQEWDISAERRNRKRSMSLDQSVSGRGHRGTPDDSLHSGGVSSRARLLSDRDRARDWAGSEGSDFAYSVHGGDAPFDGRYRDRDHERFGYGYRERERHARPHADWLGPRTAKAFAAAGLLDDARDAPALRYGAFTRSTSERDFRSMGMDHMRERDRWSPMNGRTSIDSERDRSHYRYNFTSSARSGNDRDFTALGMRAGAETPTTVSMTRPPSRVELSSHNRPPPLFSRTISDLMSHRATDGRENSGNMHRVPGSGYSPSGGETGGDSAASGEGRASPTTTSSLAAAQSQIQHLKEKHDAQTEALLGALADSQKTAKELKEENEALKERLRLLEERLAETIASSRQREKELTLTMRTRQHSPERIPFTRPQAASNNRHLSVPKQSKSPSKSTPSPKKRRLSTSSSVFPSVPASMSLLMAQTPGSPPQGSLTSDSRPSSPTLVTPKSAPDGSKGTVLAAPQPISISHKRSTSGASMATSANFSFETGSPGSLKLKPEHELLLGDMTSLSLVTGIGGESENES